MQRIILHRESRVIQATKKALGIEPDYHFSSLVVGGVRAGGNAIWLSLPSQLVGIAPISYIIEIMSATIPSSIQGLVWTKGDQNLDLEQDSSVIVHHTLRYGHITDIAWLLAAYPKEKIISVFKTQPLTIYSPASLHFAKSTVLNITEELPNERRYLQSFF